MDGDTDAWQNQADGARGGRGSAAVNGDTHQRLVGQRRHGPLQDAAERYESEFLVSVRPSRFVSDGVVARPAPRVHRQKKNEKRRPGTTAQFMHLVRSGGWSPANWSTDPGTRWFALARSQGLSLRFRLRYILLRVKRARGYFTFGVQSNSASYYALPCVNLQWDGRRSWEGNLTGHAWSGAGVDVMGAFWERIQQRVGGNGAAPLQCVLTVDDDEDPEEVVWSIVRTGGEPLITWQLTRDDSHPRPTGGTQSDLLFERLARSTFWNPAGPVAAGSHKWLALARSLNLSLRFRKRVFPKRGGGTLDLLTFGMEFNRTNYALPCGDLHWSGRSWVGNVTWDAWRGAGGALMGEFRKEIKALLCGSGSVNLLFCVLTVDDVVAPHDMVWKIVRSGDDAIISWRLQKSRDVIP